MPSPSSRNSRLTKANEVYAELEQGCLVTGVKKVQANTVREMQEMFYELMDDVSISCGHCGGWGFWSVKAVKDNIDRIADEILNKTEE